MSLTELKTRAKELLYEYVQSSPETQYCGCALYGGDSMQFFADLSKKVGLHYGWVYVAWTSDTQCKIGHTCVNPISRVRQVFPYCGGKTVYVSAFPSVHKEPWVIERYIQNILYSLGLQSLDRELGGIKAYSGGTEIFDISPQIACYLIDEAVKGLRLCR